MSDLADQRPDDATAAEFEEQLWPVNCAIIVLAGVLVGILCARGNFDL